MTAAPEQLIVMGVSGSGKTTLGRALAAQLGLTFLDADDFHTPEAAAKMACGEGLTDAERQPWLMRLRSELSAHAERREGVVLACSALKAAYRTLLRGPQTHSDQPPTTQPRFIYLEVPADELRARLERRSGSYAGPALLPSQLGALEPPGVGEALIVHVPAGMGPRSVLAEVLGRLTSLELASLELARQELARAR